MSNRKMIKCSICVEEVPFDLVPRLHGHAGTVCNACILRHAKTEISGKMGTRVGCLHSGCTKEIDLGDLKRLGLSAPLLETMDSNLFRAWLNSQENFRWCSHAGCGSGYLLDDLPQFNIMTCRSCRRRTCAHHRTVYHDGLTCKQYDDLLAQTSHDDQSEVWIKNNTKPCPKCTAPVQKNGGCDHMTCRKPGGCGHEFCWMCLADYNEIRKDGNHRHKLTCHYYAAPPPAAQ